MSNLLIITLTTLELQLQTPMYFFPEELIFPGCVPCVCSNPQIHCQQPNLQQFHFHFRMCLSATFNDFLWSRWGNSPHCHVLWLLCSYMLSPELWGNHECWCLCTDGRCFLGHWGALWSSVHHWHIFYAILWLQCDPTVFLWCVLIAKDFLSWNTPGSLHKYWNRYLLRHVLFHLYCDLLCLYFIHCAKDSNLKGQSKAFSTCFPHLIVFTLFIITACFVYLKPSANPPSVIDRLLSVIYTVVPPILNPIIYSLRNKDMKQAIMRLLHKTCGH